MLPSSTVLIPKNARGRSVTTLCLTLETFRRTDDGRVRDANAFLGHFFPQSNEGSRDRLFVHMPKEVRANLLSNWGIRGKKSALRDDDEKVRLTVADALAAGDIDATVMEAGVTPEILVDWLPLDDWWTFWRGNALPLGAVRKALAVARELALFDERWFLENLKLGSQKLMGTDVICAALSKDQIVAWLQAVHTSGDASPAGLVASLGWETILAKTAHEALTFALDGLARQLNLSNAPVDTNPDRANEHRAPAPAPQPAPAQTTSIEPQKALVASVPKSAPVAAQPPGPPSAASAAPADFRTSAPMRQTQNVTIGEPTTTVAAPAPPPIPPAPVSSPPTARALFGAPPSELQPMRAPARTLAGVGSAPPFEGATAGVAMTTFEVSSEGVSADDPATIPPRAEPGDMGWDLAHGVKRPMPNNVQPKYNFKTDDEPTSEIDLSGIDGQT
jgi:hypothetical protein